MNVRLERFVDCTFVIPEGRIDFTSAPAFQAQLEQAISQQRAPAAVIVDCGALEYVSSAGLRAFLIAARAAQKAAIGFALCALQPAVREVFELSGFNRIMQIHADRETARALAQVPRA